MKRFINFMNGVFPCGTLLNPYKRIWSVMTWSALVVVTIKFVLFPMFECWDVMVAFLNNVIWG